MQTPVYNVEGDAFVRHNGDSYCNRPLYCNQIYAAAIGGDKPYCVAGVENTVLGNLMFALLRDGKGKWLHKASDVTSTYRPGRLEWIVKDADWGPTVVHLELVPVSHGPGMAVHLRMENARPGDKVVWASGAAITSAAHFLWQYDLISQHTDLRTRGFVPADCANNRVEVKDGGSWVLHPSGEKSGGFATGVCSVPATITSADAGDWENPAALAASQGYVAADCLRRRAGLVGSGCVLDTSGSRRRRQPRTGGRVCRRHEAGNRN